MDASVEPVDVALMGLPIQDASTSSETSFETSGLSLSSLGSNGELIVPLRQNASAPFSGVLFNGPAVARVSVEFTGLQQRCQIERQHDVSLVTARYTADTESLRLALETQRRTDDILLGSRNEDIARLNRLVAQQSTAINGPHIGEGLVWASGGLLMGVLIVGGVVIFASSRP
jgi:hypothetical protein